MAEERIIATTCLSCGDSEFTLPRGFRLDDDASGDPFCARCTEVLPREDLRTALLVAAHAQQSEGARRRR